MPSGTRVVDALCTGTALKYVNITETGLQSDDCILEMDTFTTKQPKGGHILITGLKEAPIAVSIRDATGVPKKPPI